MNIFRILIPAICAFIFTLPAGAQNSSQKVAEGNKLFAEEKYDEANNKYSDALIEHPESAIIHFNVGDVLYKKRNFEKALEAYQKALSTEDILLQAKAYYNMGNTLYKMDKLPESILHYKKALELNPEDEDAKYNLEFVRTKLKDDAQKQNQDQDQKQEPVKPSEFAKKLLEEAKALVAQRKYVDAKELLEGGLKVDKTVEAFRDFMTRLDDVISIGE